jgi:hypothetical protein
VLILCSTNFKNILPYINCVRSIPLISILFDKNAFACFTSVQDSICGKKKKRPKVTKVDFFIAFRLMNML